MDLLVLEGEFQGETIEDICKFEKSRLVICQRDPESAKKGRPITFITKADSALGVITLERVK